jgi:nuclear transport factor 2 (NTF2) superfamily protein
MRVLTSLFLALSPLIFSACTVEENAKTMNHPDDIQAFADAYTAAWNSQNPASVASYYAQNGVLTINGGEPAAGRAAVEGVARDFMDAFPDLYLINDRMEAAGERMNYHWTLSGTNTGPGGTGNRVVISGFEAWVFDEGGLILDSVGTYDADDYDRQLNGGQ